jgi:hypothetical protein
VNKQPCSQWSSMENRQSSSGFNSICSQHAVGCVCLLFTKKYGIAFTCAFSSLRAGQEIDKHVRFLYLRFCCYGRQQEFTCKGYCASCSLLLFALVHFLFTKEAESILLVASSWNFSPLRYICECSTRGRISFFVLLAAP